MNDSLIQAILSQAENPGAKPEDWPELNSLLKAKCYSSYFSWALNGGVEDDYKNIGEFVTLNDKEIITHFNTEFLLTHGDVLLQDATTTVDRKLAYKAGICFALTAVYAEDVSKKKIAYEQLVTLFAETGLLYDSSLLTHCNEFLAPVVLDKIFNSTRSIAWLWEVTGKNKVLSFEAERQKLLQVEFAQQPIKKALFLLGLSEHDALTEEKIKAVCNGCKKRLQEISGLSIDEVAIYPLFKCFHDAQNLLLHFLKFIGFSCQNRVQALETSLQQVKAEEITQDDIFINLYQLINALDADIKELINVAHVEPPYITNEMIGERLGAYVADVGQYKIQEQLRTLTLKFWEEICTKIAPLLLAAKELLTSHEDISLRIGSFIELGSKLEKISGLVAQIKEVQLKESWALPIANHVVPPWDELTRVMERIKQQIIYYKALVRINIGDLIRLSECLAQNEAEGSIATDTSHFLSAQQSLVGQINTKLDWLQHLNGTAKALIESELNNQAWLSTSNDSLDSMMRNLEGYRTKLTSFGQQGADKLNEVLQQEINALLQQYEAANNSIDVCFKERNRVDFSWENTWDELLKKQQTLNNEWEILNKKIPTDYTKTGYIIQVTATFIARLAQKKLAFEQKVAEVKEQIEQSAIDTFHYLLLKKRIQQQAGFFAMNGENEFFAQLTQGIEQMCSYDTGTRYVALVELIKSEQNDIAEAQTSNCFGWCRPTWPQTLFTNILNESERLALLVPQNKWANTSLSLDALQYTILRNQIEQECTRYMEQGAHHQDRKDSITRLMQRINQLEQQEGAQKNRFLTLYRTLKNEEAATMQSHLRIGFFPGWHSCRLQKIYGKILHNAERVNDLTVEAAEVTEIKLI